jgi:hypothetical protein
MLNIFFKVELNVLFSCQIVWFLYFLEVCFFSHHHNHHFYHFFFVLKVDFFFIIIIVGFVIMC